MDIDTQAVADDQQETTGQESTLDAEKPVTEVKDLPDWAQEKFKNLRQENAKNRVAQKAAETATQEAEAAKLIKDGKIQEAYDGVKAELDAANERAKVAERLRIVESVARRHKLPEVLLSRLQGDTEEEIEADALILLDAIPTHTPAVSGTDAASGTNSTVPLSQPSNAEIQEMAVNLGVNPAHLTKTLGIKE